MHLTRYFCKFPDRQNVVQSGGLIYASDDWEPLSDDTGEAVWPRHWHHYKEYSSIILLGPPRQGKTTEFQFQSSQISNGFYLPLRDVTDPKKPDDTFSEEDQARWTAWRKTDQTAELFVDALDEGKLAEPVHIKYLTQWLKSLGSDVLKRLRIHLSCRESEWKNPDEEIWLGLFPSEQLDKKNEKPAYVVLALLNLDQEAIHSYCSETGVNPEEFFSNLPKHAIYFLQRPQTLRMILESYQRTKTYPQNLKDLYEQVIAIRLNEYNEYRHYRKVVDVSIQIKRRIAERYAISTLLSGREIITDFGTEEHKYVLAGVSGKSLDIERAVFATELFEWYSDKLFRFNDQALAEYLAAFRLDKLMNQAYISPPRLAELFFPFAGSDEVVPNLRTLAGWLSALNASFRRLMISRNPWFILNDYVGNLTDKDRVDVWQWFIKKYADREWFDWRPISHYIGQLACGAIVPDLKRVLRDKNFGGGLRYLALEIIHSGLLKALTEEVISILLDDDEKLGLKRYAAEVLMDVSPERIAVLNKWLSLPAEQDPDRNLLATALELLWPHHIDIDTLISCLRLKSNADHFGQFRLLPSKLANKMQPDDRSIILNEFSRDLEEALTRYRAKNHDIVNDWHDNYHAASDYHHFFLSQLKVWKDLPSKASQLENWLSILAEASHYGFVTRGGLDNINKLLRNEHSLRQQLSRLRIERLFTKGKQHIREVDLYPHIGNDPYWPQKEDIPFWQQVIIEWSGQDDILGKLGWWYFLTAWEQAGYSTEVWDWIEQTAEQVAPFHRIWEQNKMCPYDPASDSQRMHIDNAKDKIKRDHEWSNWVDSIRDNINSLRTGEFRLLKEIDYQHHFKKASNVSIEKWVKEEFDDSVAKAFTEGLHSYWLSAEPPDLETIYLTNTVPWFSIFVMLAVDSWHTRGQLDWAATSRTMRQKALIAGLWNLNRFPDWYSDATNNEQEYVEKLFLRLLDMEARSNDRYPRLANLLDDYGEYSLFREIAYQYLQSNPKLRIEVALPLLKCIMTQGLSYAEADELWSQAVIRFGAGDINGSLVYFAVLWRYYPMWVWPWIEQKYLGYNESRKANFDKWMSTLERVHLSRHSSWPDWVSEKTLVDLLPDLYTTYPPKKDPSVREFNTGDNDVKRRSDLGHMRINAFTKLAESGSDYSGSIIRNLLDNPSMGGDRTSLLNFMDVWRTAHAKRTWKPLKPHELWEVLEKEARPVRTHGELFTVVCEVLDDIANEIKNGEVPIKELLWQKKGAKLIPRAERLLQILVADKIKGHQIIRNKRLVSGREIEVAGNFPDIFISCILPNEMRSKVYIEVKRQQNNELLNSMDNQLAKKYLQEPEAKHGVFLVGWFGPRRYGVSKKNLTKKFAKIPASAETLGLCLQKLCNAAIARYANIDEIKAIVIDCSI